MTQGDGSSVLLNEIMFNYTVKDMVNYSEVSCRIK